ncbi:MAG TPA: hypothetical protein VEI98_15755 [Xanthobacteraceae bacterium]|nr:hypothetical protein [Xanthobacteraceae bacterium]
MGPRSGTKRQAGKSSARGSGDAPYAVAGAVVVALVRRPAGSGLERSLEPPLQPLEPGSYDFARDLFFQGIGASGFVRGTMGR